MGGERVGEIHLVIVLLQDCNCLPGGGLLGKEAKDRGATAAHGGPQGASLEEGGFDPLNVSVLVGGKDGLKDVEHPLGQGHQIPPLQGGDDPAGVRPKVALGLVSGPEEGGGGDGEPRLAQDQEAVRQGGQGGEGFSPPLGQGSAP